VRPLAYSVSPVQGRDRRVLRRLCSLSPGFRLIWQRQAARRYSKSLQRTRRTTEAIRDLIVAAMCQGVGQLQFNVVNAETLRAAQGRSADTRTSACALSGFSQQFACSIADAGPYYRANQAYFDRYTDKALKPAIGLAGLHICSLLVSGCLARKVDRGRATWATQLGSRQGISLGGQQWLIWKLWRRLLSMAKRPMRKLSRAALAGGVGPEMS